MFKKNEILDLTNRNSLTRQTLDRQIYLSEYGLEGTDIPKGFKGMSFTPKKGLNLPELMNSIEKDLNHLSADNGVKRQVSKGLCEAIKNAYEHGNDEDNSLNIDLFRKYSGKGGAEFLVGDRGKLPLDGNFIPYAMVLRSNEVGHEDPENFYDFKGQNYAPQGHSGIGMKLMKKSFDSVEYYKNLHGGLLVYLQRSPDNLRDNP